MELPSPDEIREWIGKDLNHLNPEVKPYFLMGIESLYVHLGGERILKVKMPEKKD